MDPLLIVWLICGLIGTAIGAKKNRMILGLLLGFALDVIGLIIMMFVSERDGPPEGMADLGKMILTAVIALGAIIALIVFGLPKWEERQRAAKAEERAVAEEQEQREAAEMAEQREQQRQARLVAEQRAREESVRAQAAAMRAEIEKKYGKPGQ